MFIVMSAWIKIIETLNDVVTHLKILNIQEQANSVDGKKYGKKSKEGDKKQYKESTEEKLIPWKRKYDWQVLAKLTQRKRRPKFVILAIKRGH